MILDLVFLGVVGLFAFYGFRKGLSFAIGFGISMFMAFTMTSTISLFLIDKVLKPLGVGGNVFPSLLLILLNVVVFYVLIKYMPNILSKVIKVATLGIGNRILGVLVFTIFGILSFTSLYVLCDVLGIIPASFVEDSLTHSYLNKISEPIYSFFHWVMPDSIDYLEGLTKD
tara:strand:+ start:182 stop:694 length:513 start_codon:yes stop_codon:yes gene_type:complete